MVIADTAKCECPECSGLEEDSVCARVGTEKITYKNPCEAQREACNQSLPLEILNVGECGGNTNARKYVLCVVQVIREIYQVPLSLMLESCWFVCHNYFFRHR